ncbi:MAG: hypothetical protein K1X57_06870 [Gemmataceae bacterium]|nr:hypothetical protein [Gemmataceae bacterium]
MARDFPRRRRFSLGFLELERRITPAQWSVWQPIAPAELAWANATAATAWHPGANAIATSSSDTGAQRYLPLTLLEAFSQSTLAAAPSEKGLSEGMQPLEIALPRPDGNFERFGIWSVDILPEELSESYPVIRTYRGQGLDDPTAVLAADFTYQGFHAQVFAARGSYVIEPTQAISNGHYFSYFNSDYASPHGGGCTCPDCLSAAIGAPTTTPGTTPNDFADITNGVNRRTFRLAAAANGEFTAQAGGSVAAGLSAITTVVNSVSAIYERDLAVRFTLVANNNLIIYTNAATDPYTGNNAGTMLGENQTNLDSVIGSANYDIGHVFGGGNLGGVANLGVVGAAGSKARGVSTTDGSGSTTNAWMTIVVAHEMGHQFNAGHTFNGVSTSLTPNRMSASAWEPGSGSTIMAYGHVGEGNGFVGLSDTYFHGGTLAQIISFLGTIPSVGSSTATGNALPSANAGVDRTIPANTFFELTGTSTDTNGDVVTFTWDQVDLGAALLLGSADNGSSPLFRSFSPSTSKTRTLRSYSDILKNTVRNTEVMPTTTRSLNFRFSARDNRAGGGGLTTDDIKLSVVNTGAAFKITSPNSSAVLSQTTPQTITWDVAGTTANGINATSVKILLSTDGGQTFPHTLIASTPNDGTQTVSLPAVSSSTCRIRIQPTANIFFDVSDADFTIATFTPGDTKVTNTNDAGPGSFRQAVINANFTPGVDTITFDPTVFATAKTITLATNGPITTESLEIRGPAAGVTLDAGQLGQIFRVSAPGGSTVSIFDVTFANGKPTANTNADQGGAINAPTDTTLNLTRCNFIGNTTNTNGGAVGHLGGANGVLNLVNCTFQGNTAPVAGGAISLNNGFASTPAKLNIIDSVLSGNSASIGGAIYFVGVADVTITRSTLTANSASDGAGLFTLGAFANPASTVRIDSSALINNTAFRGAGLLVQGRTALTIDNSTVSGNRTGNYGAGIAFLNFDSADAAFTLRQSTITNNTANGYAGGGVFLTRASTQPVVIQNSVISGNSQSDNTSPDIYGPANATGGNAFIGIIGPASIVLSGAGNQTGTIASPLNALLGPLAGNGGTTQTHLPLPGSPLVNAGGATTVTLDQRGLPRTSGPAVDIGSAEAQQIKVLGVQVNDGSVQRSRVTGMTVTFDSPPALAGSAFSLRRQSDNAAVALNATLLGNAVSLSFTGGPLEAGSLADGRYTLVVSSPAVNLGGLDGNGDGTPGDDFTLTGTPGNGLFRLFGDADGDGTVTSTDFLQFRVAFLGTNPVFDGDGNGTVDSADFLQFRLRFLQAV